MIRILIISVICLFISWCIPNQIYAAEEFRSDYNVEYAVSSNGTTIVTQKITLTNRLTNIYPKQYSILLDTDKIRNIIAYDNAGSMNPTVTVANGKTTITVIFNDQIVGIGKQQTFTLRFENTEIAQKNGSIWEINVPGIADNADLGTYTVTLQVPETFGPNAYMSPIPSNGHVWTKEQMITGGISAAYGTEQFFDVHLTYVLENTESSKKLIEIALPPDNAFQKVSIRSIDPQPLNVVRDSDGNWMAKYEVESKSSLNVSVAVIISVTLKPRIDFGNESINSPEYLKPTRYWNSQDPSIMALAKSYKTPREIYSYIVKTFSYDYDRVGGNPTRKGAVEALLNPKNSVCMEFTDAFIAIARAAGIPARQAIGFSYTTNAKLRPLSLVLDVLHAWPEYYDMDRHIWIGIDPTWANTTGGINYFDKLDFNHIVFVINGTRDDYPYPAGSYRQEKSEGKFVSVQFADPETAKHVTGKLISEITFPKQVTAGIPATGRVRIGNITGVGINDVTVRVVSHPSDLDISKVIDHIPPFTHVDIPIQFITHSFITGGNGQISVTVNGELNTAKFAIQPLYVIIAYIIGIFLCIVLIIWFILKKKIIINHHSFRQ